MKAIIGVLTCQKMDARRAGVLRTWGRSIREDPDLDFVFLIGDPTLAVPRRECDVLYVPCPDDYDSLPQKTRWFCVWLTELAEQQWDVAMKVDDDTYLQVDRLKPFLERAAADERVDVYGADDGNHFHGGAGYTMNRDAAAAIAEHVRDLQGLEDWKACAALHTAGLHWADEPRFCFDKKRLPMPANEQITAHYCSPVRQRLLWDDFRINDSPAESIPKILHHVWLGGEMPAAKRRLRQTWLERHPDWEHRLWTDDSLEQLEITNRTQLKMATKPAQRCHIIRYEILRQFGGVYVDCDVESFKPIDPFLQADGFAAAEDDDHIGIAVIGCKPGDSMIQRAIDILPASYGSHDGDCARETGSGLFTRAFFDHDHDWRLHYWHTFYPRHWTGRENGPLDRAYAQHNWDASWQK